MRPQYLKDIISLSAGEAGEKALRALTKLCNFLLSGQLPSEICHLLHGASLCALNKKDGGIRPIAIGNCLRRLTSKLACFQSRDIVNSYLSPHQLGVATKLGCEAAIHTTRTFVNNDQNRGKVLLKLDFKNAFNSVQRDCILKEIQSRTPLLYPYLYQCYRNPSTLFFGNHLISSSVGAQQGDPCGPMIFSLAIQPIILSLDSELNIWYLDDGTLADYPEVVLSDFKKVINLSQEIGLELNFNKCEIFCCSGDTDLKVIKEFQNLAPGIKICDRESLSLLGSPIFDQGFKNTVEKTIITVENLLNKAELLNRHVAYTLIKNCLFIPKLNFLLRTTPFWKFSNYVNSIDSSLERILNLRLTNLQWRQSTLEPNGLSRNDGKRPDGMTLVLWIKGQPLVWDVTVVDTLADGYVLKSSEVSGSAAEMACKRKHSKYSSIISSNYVFKGLAFETLGPWCKESGDSKSKNVETLQASIIKQKCYVIMLLI
jgi:hypothetical protein